LCELTVRQPVTETEFGQPLVKIVRPVLGFIGNACGWVRASIREKLESSFQVFSQSTYLSGDEHMHSEHGSSLVWSSHHLFMLWKHVERHSHYSLPVLDN